MADHHQHTQPYLLLNVCRGKALCRMLSSLSLWRSPAVQGAVPSWSMFELPGLLLLPPLTHLNQRQHMRRNRNTTLCNLTSTVLDVICDGETKYPTHTYCKAPAVGLYGTSGSKHQSLSCTGHRYDPVQGPSQPGTFPGLKCHNPDKRTTP